MVEGCIKLQNIAYKYALGGINYDKDEESIHSHKTRT